jgi:hypothetical protein
MEVHWLTGLEFLFIFILVIILLVRIAFADQKDIG